MSVQDDESVFMLIKSDSRVHYEKAWFNFKAFFPENDFGLRMPSEVEIMKYFQHFREAIVIAALFGGLRQIECIDLKLEKFVNTDEGVYVVHQRAKQRSDKKETKFLIPKTSGADRIDYAR